MALIPHSEGGFPPDNLALHAHDALVSELKAVANKHGYKWNVEGSSRPGQSTYGIRAVLEMTPETCTKIYGEVYVEHMRRFK